MAKRPLSRLLAGLGLLALLALAAVGTTTSALAQVPTGPFVGTARLTCQTGSANTAATGTTSTTACGISPGGIYTLYTDFFFASQASGTTGIGSAPAGQSQAFASRLLQLHLHTSDYPRWGHAANSHWFYLIATNIASAQTGVARGADQFQFSYYAPPRRTLTTIASTATPGNTGAGASAATGTDGTVIYAQASPNAPIATVRRLQIATSMTTSTTGFGSMSFESELRWGKGQEWWRGGTVVFSQGANEITSVAPTGTGTAASPSTTGTTSTGRTLTLTNATTVQGIATSGNRTVTAGSAIPYVLTATDADGDVERVKLVFRNPGQTNMFYVAVRAGENNEDTVNPLCAAATQEYQSNSESLLSLPCGTQFTTNYLGTTSTGSTSSVSSSGSATSVTYTFSLVPSTAARGTWNVYAQTSDFHGTNTGEVLVGTLTVT